MTKVSALCAFKLQAYMDGEAEDTRAWGCGHHKKPCWPEFSFSSFPPPVSRSCSFPYITLGCQRAMSIWHEVCHEMVRYLTANKLSLQVVKMEKRKLFHTIYSRNRFSYPFKRLTPSQLSEEHHCVLQYTLICPAIQPGDFRGSSPCSSTAKGWQAREWG